MIGLCESGGRIPSRWIHQYPPIFRWMWDKWYLFDFQTPHVLLLRPLYSCTSMNGTSWCFKGRHPQFKPPLPQLFNYNNNKNNELHVLLKENLNKNERKLKKAILSYKGNVFLSQFTTKSIWCIGCMQHIPSHSQLATLVSCKKIESLLGLRCRKGNNVIKGLLKCQFYIPLEKLFNDIIRGLKSETS